MACGAKGSGLLWWQKQKKWRGCLKWLVTYFNRKNSNSKKDTLISCCTCCHYLKRGGFFFYYFIVYSSVQWTKAWFVLLWHINMHIFSIKDSSLRFFLIIIMNYDVSRIDFVLFQVIIVNCVKFFFFFLYWKYFNNKQIRIYQQTKQFTIIIMFSLLTWSPW